MQRNRSDYSLYGVCSGRLRMANVPNDERGGKRLRLLVSAAAQVGQSSGVLHIRGLSKYSLFTSLSKYRQFETRLTTNFVCNTHGLSVYGRRSGTFKCTLIYNQLLSPLLMRLCCVSLLSVLLLFLDVYAVCGSETQVQVEPIGLS